MPIQEKHEILKLSSDNFKLWRYMDFQTFLSLLIDKSLTFVRADLFEDKYEGTLPKITASQLDTWARKSIEENKLHKQYYNLSEMLNGERYSTYLSCWCKQNFEMIHMWKIYSKQNGVAIETDYRSLINALQTDEFIYPTEVEYHNFDEPIIYKSNALQKYTIKRREYQSENEFRLIISNSQKIDKEIENLYQTSQIYPYRVEYYKKFPILKCPIDIHDFIKKIHLSPFAPKWYIEILEDLVQKYEIGNVPVIQSDL